MIGFFRSLSSTRFTLVGMGLLGLGAALSYDNPVHTPIWVLVIPLLLLAINLVAAIVFNARIKSNGGLLVFHLGLLGIVVLAAIGRLTYMDAHLEIIEGGGFSAVDLIDIDKGPLHSGKLEQVRFIQGPYTVDYSPGMIRGLTHSHVRVPDGKGGWEEKIVGDDRPLVVEGYRFYTTFNKGFAPVLTWMPASGEPVTGVVHMPSYPLFEFKQSNSWTPPGGQEIKFWLQLETGLDEGGYWRLDGRRSQGTLIVSSDNRRLELLPGDQVRLPGGTLRYEHLTTWMGYKLFYDPTIQWLFMFSMLGIIGLAIHFWHKVTGESAVSVSGAVTKKGLIPKNSSGTTV